MSSGVTYSEPGRKLEYWLWCGTPAHEGVAVPSVAATAVQGRQELWENRVFCNSQNTQPIDIMPAWILKRWFWFTFSNYVAKWTRSGHAICAHYPQALPEADRRRITVLSQVTPSPLRVPLHSALPHHWLPQRKRALNFSCLNTLYPCGLFKDWKKNSLHTCLDKRENRFKLFISKYTIFLLVSKSGL